jgi:cell division protease FtsH
MGQVQSYSDQTAAEIDEEIKNIIDECYEETKKILLEKKAVVEGLASRLIEKLTVDGPDFEKIYMANGNLDLAFATAAPAAVPAETETPAPAESEEGNTSEE